MRRPIAWIACFLCFGLSLSTQVFACQGTTDVFDDKFTSIDPAWSNLASYYGKIDNGHLLLEIPPQTPTTTPYATHSLNQNNSYTDAVFCVTFSFDATQDPSFTTFGLSFWGTDDSAFYTFTVSANGHYQVSRKIADNRFLFPIPWTANPLIKTEFGQKQELEVRTKQNSAELFIGGTKVGDLKGIIPNGGGTVGIFYQTPGTGGKISVTEFQVKN